jgi:hypothetical protein
MATRRFWRPHLVTLCVALVGLLLAPVGTSMLWATSHEQPRMMNKRPTMQGPGMATSTTTIPNRLQR